MTHSRGEYECCALSRLLSVRAHVPREGGAGARGAGAGGA